MTEFELDFLPVGSGEKSGDAIILRVWETMSPHSQRIFVIDGGTKESGSAIVDHIKCHYKSNHVDCVISTHPDNDHISGLSEVLEGLDVDNLLMHKPWDYASNIKNLFENPQLTTLGVQRMTKRDLQSAHDLYKTAVKKDIKIYEPFAGTNGYNNLFHILGPTEDYYKKLLTQFDCTPEPKEKIFSVPLYHSAFSKKEKIKWEEEYWNTEKLEDGTEHFSAENSSSAIILFNIGQYLLLFAGDADEIALNSAIDYAINNKFDLSNLHLFHVPHHGSKQNVGPSLLNRIKAQNAQISAGPEAPKHPSFKVTNALIRRGTAVYTTCGLPIRHASLNAPARTGWFPVSPFLFSQRVQE